MCLLNLVSATICWLFCWNSLKKSSWEGVCYVHSPICALEVDTNRLVGIRTEQDILSLSCIDHNQNLIRDTQSCSVSFTLSEDGTGSKHLYHWLHSLVVTMVVEWCGVEKGMRKLTFLSFHQKSDFLKSTNCIVKMDKSRGP